ncbi:MAG: hypothetical protein QHH14_07815 [Clostridiales bacterium]|nr:hypothetical protein [Clostridiales bacterium]
MARVGKKIALCLSGVLVFGVSEFFALSITVAGTWTLVINQSALQGPPGSDLISIHESGLNQIMVTVDMDAWWHSYRVDVRKVDSNWHSNLRLYIRRTGNGTGLFVPSGGLNYLEITGSNTLFFTGIGDRSNIPLRERIEGVSVDIPVATYTTTIIFTLTRTN